MAKKSAQVSEKQFEDANRVLQRWYFDEVRYIAQDAIDNVKSGEIANEDALNDWLHERIDGSQLVIYTWQARLVLVLSEHPDAYIDDTGSTEGAVTKDDINWSALAYFALMADVQRLLDARRSELKFKK